MYWWTQSGKIKNIGRWVIIEKDWSNDIEDYYKSLEIANKLKKITEDSILEKGGFRR